MYLKRQFQQSETQKKKSLLQRMVIVHCFLLVCALLLVARLLELQVIDRSEYSAAAQSQHYGGVKLPAQRGEVLALNSKTGETSILATNTTLDLAYVDPFVTENPTFVAETLADTLLSQEFHDACSAGKEDCPRELIAFPDSPYAAAFDPLQFAKSLSGTSLLEPLPSSLPTQDATKATSVTLTEARRLFSRDIERRISEDMLTFVPLLYGANKLQMNAVADLRAPGIVVNVEQNLIYANPEEVDQGNIPGVARKIAEALSIDAEKIDPLLRSRPLRYVPIMRKLPPALSLKLKEAKLASLKLTNDKKAAANTQDAAEKIHDPLRGIALLPEHWRYYPDGTIASHIVGFLNNNQEAQYGIERTFDVQLRGQEGLISTLSDPTGGQILTAEQTIVDAKDGDTVVLTIDPFVQKEVERILDEGIKKYQADSGQAIVMDPYTGKIIAMANAPLFERNEYAGVYDRMPIYLPQGKVNEIVIEIIDPETNSRVVKDYANHIFSQEGRASLTAETQKILSDLELKFDLHSLARYYMYVGENNRHEIFPTDIPGVWLKYKNSIGVGAYLNRNIQEIYEPGSVMKPITAAIALDQGEIAPSDEYLDKDPVKIDDTHYIYNNDRKFYGRVNMTNCIEYSINTCMTMISEKLGRKLFQRMIERFGFGRVTNIELEDELSGEVLPWRKWPYALLLTASFGQGISSTPLQMVTAFSALGNGGKLMQPSIIDHIRHPDGTVEKKEPKIVDQVITEETSETITAMLVSSGDYGFAKAAKPKGYKIAGKTGTSQIAGPGGRYEAGTGATIATFAGYAPPSHPKFTVLVKLDRPRSNYIVHGATSAAPIFKDIATFLFKYYGIPPDEQ